MTAETGVNLSRTPNMHIHVGRPCLQLAKEQGDIARDGSITEQRGKDRNAIRTFFNAKPS
jgi:hypothetical protein